MARSIEQRQAMRIAQMCLEIDRLGLHLDNAKIEMAKHLQQYRAALAAKDEDIAALKAKLPEEVATS